ncbi:MAG: hypothetical protein C4551_08930 [Bacillota bacterium]|nr:MAG: hypothetical protein C4551_08930 [Bacillota bacterium]
MKGRSEEQYVHGELVAVFRNDDHRPVHWYQRPGMCRKLRGSQVFLDPRHRTSATIDGKGNVIGVSRPPKDE